jgi:hypothetical protein
MTLFLETLNHQYTIVISVTTLKITIKAIKKSLKASDDDELDFLEESESKVDKLIELSFNILKDIYITKKDAAKTLRDAAAIKENNQKILVEIARRKELKITQISDEELEAMLK